MNRLETEPRLMSLDIENPSELVRYLRDSGRIGPSDSPAITVLAGGVSNRTVRVEPATGPVWVLKQALPKLRVVQDWYCDPGRIEREALGLQWLETLTPPGSVPRLLFADRSNHLLAMEAVPSPHENWKTRLLRGQVDLAHVRQFGELLGHIHRRSAESRAALASLFDDRTYFEDLRLDPYYRVAAERNSAARGFLLRLIADTRSTRTALVHGDYSPKNILVHQGRLVLLDHEVIHFGDPAFDVGFSTTHLLSKAHHLQKRRAAFLDAARLHWESYTGSLTPEHLAPGLEARAVRHTLGCLLARVDGRSPLEYLTAAELDRQRRIATGLMAAGLARMPDLIQAFANELDR